MGVFNKLFGNTKTKDTLKDTNYLETIINSSDDEPLATSSSNVMYAGYNELGGYYFLQTLIIGSFKIKTKTGAKLEINGNNYNFKLNSDMPELESESAIDFKGYVTKIDFEIEKDVVEKLKKSTIKDIKLTTKKKSLEFVVYKPENNTID